MGATAEADRKFSELLSPPNRRSDVKKRVELFIRFFHPDQAQMAKQELTLDSVQSWYSPLNPLSNFSLAKGRGVFCWIIILGALSTCQDLTKIGVRKAISRADSEWSTFVATRNGSPKEIDELDFNSLLNPVNIPAFSPCMIQDMGECLQLFFSSAIHGGFGIDIVHYAGQLALRRDVINMGITQETILQRLQLLRKAYPPPAFQVPWLCSVLVLFLMDSNCSPLPASPVASPASLASASPVASLASSGSPVAASWAAASLATASLVAASPAAASLATASLVAASPAAASPALASSVAASPAVASWVVASSVAVASWVAASRAVARPAAASLVAASWVAASPAVASSVVASSPVASTAHPNFTI